MTDETGLLEHANGITAPAGTGTASTTWPAA